MDIEKLIFLPIVMSLMIPFSGLKFRNILTIALVIILGYFAVENYFINFTIKYNLPSFANEVLTILDILLLCYFLFQGIKHKRNNVIFLATIQIVFYSIVLYFWHPKVIQASDMIADKLSSVMYLIINIVGGIIVIYALKYIESEEFSRLKKNIFIAILIFFLGVMNFIVTTNSIEVFFFLFEVTTLCSYLLIGFRKDELSINNAIRALWMNQIGGVAILVALISSIVYYDTIYFSELLNRVDSYFLLPIVFLIIAAYVKGALFPFQNWLLGAMVAPTPVSAILHSATMVKIAPFLILKIAPAFTPFISSVVSLFGAFVFLGASIMALNKDFFKEVLGLSTIALLSLMISLAALGTKESMQAAMILIVFHAIAKALLFLQAGIMEKIYHKKYISDIDSLINISPTTLFFILIGFASLTLPPFGAFIGKFMAIESIGATLFTNPINIFVLFCLILGSVVLTILYFKVTSKLFVKDTFKNFTNEKLPFNYFITSASLVVLLVVGIFYATDISKFLTNEIVIPTLFIFFVPILFYVFNIKNSVRVKEYNCGEKDEFEVSAYYFGLSDKTIKTMMNIALFFILLTLLGGIRW